MKGVKIHVRSKHNSYFPSKHGTNDEKPQSKCFVCGKSPTLTVIMHRGYCKDHREDAVEETKKWNDLTYNYFVGKPLPKGW